MTVDFDALRRWPDVEADNLYAVDSADRLIIDEAMPFLGANDSIAVYGDAYGALTIGLADAGFADIRVHQDSLSGQQALDANARGLEFEGAYQHADFGADVFAGATVVLVRLPRGLDALDEIAEMIAAHADPTATVIAGGRVKHMTPALNSVLARHFGRVDVSLARQKSRVLFARQPHPLPALSWPKSVRDEALGLTVVAQAGAFAGANVDEGTRFLLANFDDSAARAIDFGCGSGVIATWLARENPAMSVYATDQSAAAVASTRATALANGVTVEVARDDALSALPDASEDLILLNPPFHIGATVHAGIALKLFADAGRVLRPGGRLWTVWNSHLRYRGQLEQFVGPTRQVARDRTYTVAVSTRS